MIDAPETIWLTNFIKDDCGAKLGRGTISDLDHGTEYPEYRRADLPPTTAQIMADPRVQALVGLLTSALNGRVFDDIEWQIDARAALATFTKEPKK